MTKKQKQKNASHPKNTAKNVEIESESSLAKATQKISNKRKNESESESSLEETEQKTPQKQRNVKSERTSKKKSSKRKKFEGESESSSASIRRSDRIARQESDLTRAIRDLGLSSSFSSSYGIEDLPSSASGFKIRDMEAMKVTFRGASAENVVIPDVEVVNFPSEYVLTGINRHLLRSPDFDVDKLEGISDGDVLTFIDKLHDITENSTQSIGTSETHTDSLVDDLLRIARLNTWPLKIKNHEPCAIYIGDEPTVSSDPEFVIKKRSIFVLVVEDKHLKNVGYATDFGESQIAVEILACGSENIRLGETPIDQTLWAIRVISTYVTFYKAIIPAMYWMELANGLPKEQKVEVERWPIGNGLKTGFDLAEPAGRRTVLTALTKIRESLLKQPASSTPHTARQSRVVKRKTNSLGSE